VAVGVNAAAECVGGFFAGEIKPLGGRSISAAEIILGIAETNLELTLTNACGMGKRLCLGGVICVTLVAA
jgi:hypothetical protein